VAVINDDLGDGFYHFFHNAFFYLVTELAAAQAFLVAGLTPTAFHAPFMRPNHAFVIQIFLNFFLNVTPKKLKN
jgi:hypothetical protein